MKTLITAAVLSAFAFSSASAATMTCTSDNIAKSTTALGTMADGPGKMAAYKEMGLLNTDMSKGNMRSACKHYSNAQKAAMAK